MAIGAIQQRLALHQRIPQKANSPRSVERINLRNPFQLIVVRSRIEIDSEKIVNNQVKTDNEIIQGKIVFESTRGLRLNAYTSRLDDTKLKWKPTTINQLVKKDLIDKRITIDDGNKRIVLTWTNENSEKFIMTITPQISKEYITFCGFVRGFMTYLNTDVLGSELPYDTDLVIPVDYVYGKIRFTFEGSPDVRKSLAVFPCEQSKGIFYIASSGDLKVVILNENGKDEYLDTNNPMFALNNIQPRMRIINNGSTLQLGIDYPKYPGSILEICLEVLDSDIFVPTLMGQFVDYLNFVHKLRGRPIAGDKFSLLLR